MTIYAVEVNSIVSSVFSTEEEAKKYAEFIDNKLNSAYYSYELKDELDTYPDYNNVTINKYPVYNTSKEAEQS